MLMTRSARRGHGGGGGISLAFTAGSGQTAVVGTTLDGTLGTTQPKVRATRAGVGVAGIPIVWSQDADGRINGVGGAPVTVYTDASGYSTVSWGVSTLAGTRTLSATGPGFASSITATVTADVAAIMEPATITDQSGAANTAVAVPPAVRVMDQYRNVKSGVTVVWAIGVGAGAVVGGGTTGADGLATVTSYTLGASQGANSLTATVGSITGSPVTFTASASSGVLHHIDLQSGGVQSGIIAGQNSGTVVFRCKDISNAAVPNQTVSFSAGFGTPSVASAVSDVNGDVSVQLTTSTTVRTDTLVAQSAGISQSTTVASTFGALAGLVLEVQPDTNCVSGSPLPQQPVVRLVDVNLNVRTTDTTNVVASVLTGTGSLTNATKAAVAGRAVYSTLTLTNAGSGTDLLRFSAGGFTVDAAVATAHVGATATKIRMVTQPSASFTAPSLLNAYAVEATDASNVRVTGYSGQVTVSRQTGTGALAGTLTIVFVNGLATFGNTTYDTAEAGVSLHFADPAAILTAVNSSTFTTSAAGASNRPANANTLVGSGIGIDQSAATLGAVPPHAVAGITGKAYGSGGIAKAFNPLTGQERMRIRWPTGQKSGFGNCNWAIWPNPEFASGGVRYGALYVRFRQMLFWGNSGVDYENEATGTKLLFTGTGVAANNNFIMLMGTAVDNALQTGMLVEWRQQAVVINGTPAPPTVNRNIAQNNGFSGTKVFTVGVPHDFEYYIECNTLASVNGSLGNGKLRLWVDNQLIITKDDMQFRNSTHSDNIGLHKWSSTWGGDAVGQKNRNDDLYLEDVEIYGDLNLKS